MPVHSAMPYRRRSRRQLHTHTRVKFYPHFSLSLSVFSVLSILLEECCRLLLSANKQNRSAFFPEIGFKDIKVFRESRFHFCNWIYSFFESVFVELIMSIRESFEDSRIPNQCIASHYLFVTAVSFWGIPRRD